VPPESSPTPSSPSGLGSLGLDSWVTTQPPGVGPRISLLPNPQISTLPDSVASAAAPAAAGASGDVGWDDDDDKTQIYDKDTQAAAHSLLQPATSGLPGRPPPPMSRPPGTILPIGVMPPGAFGGRSTVPPAHDASFVVPPQPASSQRLPWLFAVVAAVVVAMLIWVMLPKKGGLTVTVAGGPGNKELAAVEVIVDNKVRCRASPCELPSLKSGTHYVEVRAAGYQATAKSAVAILGGQTAVHNVQLIRAGTGIKVFGEGSGLTLLVDGKEFGPLPQELREMEPGEHVIQVAGGPRYEIFTQRIIVDPDRMTPIGPIRLKVTKGLATIRAGQGAEEAEVTLKVGDSRRVLPALPVRLEVETDRSHVLVAKRKGYATFEEPIVFEDGQAEKTIEVTLTERAADDPSNRRRRPGPVGAVTGRTEATEAADPVAEPEPVNNATLHLTSTPPSNVLLDGKPLGSTPLRDIAVDPGTHRVIFIYGAERRPKTIEAAPGSNQTVSVSF
jgi:serine/threonine-protein kinase